MTEVERWGLLELPADGPASVRFHHEHGDTAYAESFRTGDQWLIRFMPQMDEATRARTWATSNVEPDRANCAERAWWRS